MSIGNKIFTELASFHGNIGFYFKDLTDGELLEINGDRVFSAASVIKIPLALTLLELVEQGKYSLATEITIDDKNRVGGTGVIQNLNHKYVPTVGELITLAISVSDNVATNQMIDLVGGPEKVNAFCLRNGMIKTQLQRKMLDMEARKAGKDNWMTATEIGKFLEVIANTIFGQDEKAKQRMMPLFKGMLMQQCRNKIPARIPAADFYSLKEDCLPPAGEVVIANKTGDLWTTQNDVAICIMPQGQKYILSICTDGLKVAGDGIVAIGDIAKGVYEYMKGKYML